MVIAVDFDGTIVEHRYPEIGKEIPFAIATLKKLQAERHLLILWSVREGVLLDNAVEFCRKRGLEFYAINANYPDEPIPSQPTCPCRKLQADLFIDDRNVGKLPDWGVIYEMLHEGWSYRKYLSMLYDSDSKSKHKKKSLWRRMWEK